MSKKKTLGEMISEAEEADRVERERYRQQRDCDHWKCYPTEWYWNGKVREMTCPDCGATNWVGDH